MNKMSVITGSGVAENLSSITAFLLVCSSTFCYMFNNDMQLFCIKYIVGQNFHSISLCQNNIYFWLKSKSRKEYAFLWDIEFLSLLLTYSLPSLLTPTFWTLALTHYKLISCLHGLCAPLDFPHHQHVTPVTGNERMDL